MSLVVELCCQVPPTASVSRARDTTSQIRQVYQVYLCAIQFGSVYLVRTFEPLVTVYSSPALAPIRQNVTFERNYRSAG